MKVLIVTGACALLQLSAYSAQPGVVPANALLMARRNPIEFVAYLAKAHIPSGIEVFINDHGLPGPSPPADSTDKARVNSAEVVRVFNSAHSTYGAGLVNGVIVVRPLKDTADFLERTGTMNGSRTVIGAMNAVRELFVPLDASASTAGGVISSIIGGSEDVADELAVELRATPSTTIIDLLNQIALQTNRAWIVYTRSTEKGAGVVRVGLLHPTGVQTGIDIGGPKQ